MSLNITNIEELKKAAEGELLELPPFIGTGKFVARVTRVSLLSLIRKGVIPNKLMGACEQLFYGKQPSTEIVDLGEMSKVMLIMAESALVKPSSQDLKEINLELTDEQVVALFNYTQTGVNSLETFRDQPKDLDGVSDGEGI